MTAMEPPVEWSLARRVGVLGGGGVMFAVVLGGPQLLLADIPNGVTYASKYGPTPLWPHLGILVSFLVGSGVLIGILLPLYKRSHGAIAIGVAVWSLLAAIMIAFGELPGDPGGRIEPWQRMLMTVILGVVAVGFARHPAAIAWALGRPAGGDAPPRR
jgi:peptidoglycan/LPS O-acetylase OafA/YrhL